MGTVFFVLILIVMVLFFGRKILDLVFNGIIKFIKYVFKLIGIAIKKLLSLVFSNVKK